MTIKSPARKPVQKSTKHGELTQKLQELAMTLQPGQLFPSQSELMNRFDVSDSTVLRSLEDLRRAGWIVRRHGVGTFVADPSLRRTNTSPHPETDTKTIAALTPSSLSFYKYCVDLLMVQVEAAGLSLVCHHTQNPSNYEAALPLEAMHPRGFVMFSYSLLSVTRRLIDHGHRAVIMGAPPVDVLPAVPTVYGDHEQGGYLATRHLLDLGHRHVAYAYSSPLTPQPLRQRLRWRGHQRALAEAAKNGQEIQSSLIEPETLAAWTQNPALVSAYFAEAAAPTGVIAWNDTEAIQLLRLLYAAGLRVPDDVSLIGYDGLPDGESTLPPLTTVNQHVEQQLRAVMELLSRPTAPPLTQSVVIVPTLVDRASCAPPRLR